MVRTIIAYGVALGAFAVALEWVQYRYLVRTHSGEFILFLVAAAFTVFGVWAGRRLTPRHSPSRRRFASAWTRTAR